MDDFMMQSSIELKFQVELKVITNGQSQITN